MTDWIKKAVRIRANHKAGQSPTDDYPGFTFELFQRAYLSHSPSRMGRYDGPNYSLLNRVRWARVSKLGYSNLLFSKLSVDQVILRLILPVSALETLAEIFKA